MKRTITIIIIGLGTLWVIATGVLLFFVAGLIGVPALLGAFVGMDTAFLVLLALFITTNTRPRMWVDPYAQSTDDLLRPPLRDEERRVTPGTIKDRSLTERISDLVESEAAKNPLSSSTPPWFVTERHDDARDAFKEGDE